MTAVQTRPTGMNRAISKPEPARLTWRDAAAAIVVAAAAVSVVAVVSGWAWPLLGSVRSGTLVAGALGGAGCAIGASIVPGTRSGFITIATILGIVATGLIVAGLITGSETVLIALGVDTVALWIVATTRHALHR